MQKKVLMIWRAVLKVVDSVESMVSRRAPRSLALRSAFLLDLLEAVAHKLDLLEAVAHQLDLLESVAHKLDLLEAVAHKKAQTTSLRLL